MLDERNTEILCAIVQSYINNPDPVGSRFITKKYAFSLSPATIRNIMADLEDMGFLRQPHTSAGRVPTDKGYRFYVDYLCSRERQFDNRAFLYEITRELEAIKNDIDILLSETTKRLSFFSHYLVDAPNIAVGNSPLPGVEVIQSPLRAQIGLSHHHASSTQNSLNSSIRQIYLLNGDNSTHCLIHMSLQSQRDSDAC